LVLLVASHPAFASGAGLAAQAPDLTLGAADITFSTQSPKVGEDVYVYAKIRNIGNHLAQNILVHFYDNRSLIGQSVMPYVEPGIPRTTWIHWTPDLPGPNTVFVIADPTDLIAESNETNNFGSRPIDVLEPLLPDLLVASALPTIEHPKGGQTIEIEVLVRNTGASGAPATILELRDNNSFVGSTVIPPLGPTGAFRTRLSWTAPPVSQDTTRVLTATVDPEAKVNETAKANNALSRAVLVGAEPLPDLRLTPSSLLLSTNFPLDNQTVTVYAELENVGSLEARDVIVGFLQDGVEFSRAVVPLVAPGFGGRAETQWNPRAGIRALAAVADPGGSIRESDESNNVGARSVFVDQYLGRIVVPDGGIKLSDDPPLENQTVTAYAVIRNDGTAPLFENHVSFFDRVEFANGSFIETKVDDDLIQTITSGSQREAQALWTPTPAGIHYLIVRAKSLGSPGEWSSLRAEGERIVAVKRSLPELVVEAVGVHPPLPRGPVTALVNVTVKNTGYRPASDVEILLYVDNTPSGKQFVTLTADRTGHLRTMVNFTVYLGPGLHNVSAFIDPENRTAEYDDRTNNVGYALVAVPDTGDDSVARGILFWGPITLAVAALALVMHRKRRTVLARYHRWLAEFGRRLDERHRAPPPGQ
jgi:subtilase family serine protease